MGTTKGLTGLTYLAAVLTAGATLIAPVAHADPDPHLPSGADNYCPGGLSTLDAPGSCMGVPYPDGTRWIESFYRNPTNPFDIPSWRRWCSFDRSDNGSSADRDYLYAGHGCGRG